MLEFSLLKGKTLTDIQVDMGNGNDEIIFTVSPEEKYRLYHRQDCCEGVDIADINGRAADLIGSPLLIAEESINDLGEMAHEDTRWTFYRLATVKGYVDIRWVGKSNGYYSVSVDFDHYKEMAPYTHYVLPVPMTASRGKL